MLLPNEVHRKQKGRSVSTSPFKLPVGIWVAAMALALFEFIQDNVLSLSRAFAHLRFFSYLSGRMDADLLSANRTLLTPNTWCRAWIVLPG